MDGKIHWLNNSYDDITSDVDNNFVNGIQAMQRQWKKFVDHKGYHVEK